LSSLYWQSVQLSTVALMSERNARPVLSLRLGAAIAAITAACDRQPSPAEILAAHLPPHPAASPTPDASDTGESPVAIDPPPPPGDLKGDIDAFSTLEACVQSHARLDPLIGDAVEAIGYDTLVRDACTVVGAAKAGDARRCAAIEVTALRDRCVVTVAELAEKPDICPWQNPDRPLRGRDAACVAIASRDPRLCAGALEEDERATCTAVTAHDLAPCAKLARAADRLHCERAAARWRAVIAAAPAKAAFSVAGELHLETLAGGAGTDVDFGRELGRGLVLQEQRGASRLAIGDAHDEGLDRLAAPMDRHDTVFVDLVVPAAGPGGNDANGRSVRIERLEATIRAIPYSLLTSARTASAGDSALGAKVISLEHVRGGRVELSIEGTFGEGPRASKGRLRIATFVRDVVGAADIYAPSSFSPPPLPQDRPAGAHPVALDAGGREP
jgi:hypothetical protein